MARKCGSGNPLAEIRAIRKLRAAKPRQFRQNRPPDTELFTYCLGFIRRRAQADVADIPKIARLDYPHHEPCQSVNFRLTNFGPLHAITAINSTSSPTPAQRCPPPASHLTRPSPVNFPDLQYPSVRAPSPTWQQIAPQSSERFPAPPPRAQLPVDRTHPSTGPQRRRWRLPSSALPVR